MWPACVSSLADQRRALGSTRQDVGALWCLHKSVRKRHARAGCSTYYIPLSPTLPTMASPLQRLLSVELQDAKDAESIELVFDNGPVRHQLSQNQEKGGTFYKSFSDKPLTFARLSVSVRLREQPSHESITISFDNVASKLQGNECRHHWGNKLIILKVIPQCRLAGVPSPSERTSTESGSSQLCFRYRVLIFGQTGVGKSSLINQVLRTEAARVENDKSGEADIEKELLNDRFILHDSQGFEPAESDNHKVVKAFIHGRKRKENIRDQLHAVWLCFQVPIPTHGERPLEEHAEMFLREAKNILGDIPIVVVFTKYDRLLTFMRAKMKAKDPEKEAAQYLRKNCIDAIKDVSGDPNILHVEFSSRRKHERGVDKLLELTCNNVCRPGQQPSVAVQRSALVK